MSLAVEGILTIVSILAGSGLALWITKRVASKATAPPYRFIVFGTPEGMNDLLPEEMVIGTYAMLPEAADHAVDFLQARGGESYIFDAAERKWMNVGEAREFARRGQTHLLEDYDQ